MPFSSHITTQKKPLEDDSQRGFLYASMRRTYYRRPKVRIVFCRICTVRIQGKLGEGSRIKTNWNYLCNTQSCCLKTRISIGAYGISMVFSSSLSHKAMQIWYIFSSHNVNSSTGSRLFSKKNASIAFFSLCYQ